MGAKLLEYENEDTVILEHLSIISLYEKKKGFAEFRLECSLPENASLPDGRFTVELEDGRRGTVIVIGVTASMPVRIRLEGEGLLS